jgi:hypothetical protein
MNCKYTYKKEIQLPAEKYGDIELESETIKIQGCLLTLKGCSEKNCPIYDFDKFFEKLREREDPE